MSKPRQATALEAQKLDYACELMRALAHPLRLRILSLIDAHETLCVHDIFGTLQLEQSVASQHLRILREVGVVRAQRRGKFVYYTLNYSRLDGLKHVGNLA
jgi:ArsR family transcriptional regulator